MDTIRSEKLRQKLLTLMDGRPDLKHHIFHLNHLRYADQVCDWLLRHGFKGATLSEWIQDKHNGSFLNMVTFIVQQVNRRAKPKPLYVGKDYLGT